MISDSSRQRYIDIKIYLLRIKDRIKDVLGKGGIYYTVLYLVRRCWEEMILILERYMLVIERKRSIFLPWSISGRRFTVEHNKHLWNTYNWERLGEEWTRDAQWKEEVVQNLLMPNVSAGGTVVEIGPGGGRWTEILQQRASNLYVIDIAEVAIDLCRKRFGSFSNIHYLLGDGATIDLPDDSVDSIWSYDVFVHINPIDARAYFREFARVLKPGGRAVIHHPGAVVSNVKERPGWRSDLTDKMILDFAHENNLAVVQQRHKTLNRGDIISIVEQTGEVISG